MLLSALPQPLVNLRVLAAELGRKVVNLLLRKVVIVLVEGVL